jgi:hypothetical protein
LRFVEPDVDRSSEEDVQKHGEKDTLQ